MRSKPKKKKKKTVPKAVEHVDSSGNCTKITCGLHVMTKKWIATKTNIYGNNSTTNDLRTEVISNNE